MILLIHISRNFGSKFAMSFSDEPGILCFAVLLESHSWPSRLETFPDPIYLMKHNANR